MHTSRLRTHSLCKIIQCFCLLLFVLSSNHVHAETKKYNLKQFQEHFKDILLVIYYANPHYQTIPFENELYSRVFRNIVFYGDRTQYVDIGEFEHEYEDGNHGDVRIVYTRNGHYLSKWIKDVLVNHPGYKGYIFMQNDVIFQFWNFLNLDRDKIWFGAKDIWHPTSEGVPEQQKCMTINKPTDPQYSGWFNTGAGMPRVEEMFDHLSTLGLDEEKKMLTANFKENAAAWYMVDFFYIPGRFSGTALRLCDLFDKVFCEISIPTMLGAMDYRQNWEETPFWWSCFNSGDSLREAYDPNYFWMHPLKFSYEVNRNFARKVFHEQFYGNLEDE